MELRRSETATRRRRELRCAHGLTLVPGAGIATAAESAAGAAATPRRSGSAWFELPRGLGVEALKGAHALLYDRLRDGLEAYAQLTEAILRRVPCDSELQELVESNLHDGAAAARRANAVISRLLDTAGEHGELTAHQARPQLTASAAIG